MKIKRSLIVICTCSKALGVIVKLVLEEIRALFNNIFFLEINSGSILEVCRPIFILLHARRSWKL